MLHFYILNTISSHINFLGFGWLTICLAPMCQPAKLYSAVVYSFTLCCVLCAVCCVYTSHMMMVSYSAILALGRLFVRQTHTHKHIAARYSSAFCEKSESQRIRVYFIYLVAVVYFNIAGQKKKERKKRVHLYNFFLFRFKYIQFCNRLI